MSEAASDGPSLVLKSTATLYLFRLQLEKYAATSESSKRGEGNSQKVYSFNPKLFYHLGNHHEKTNHVRFRVESHILQHSNFMRLFRTLLQEWRSISSVFKLVRFQILSCWLYPSSKKLKK